MTMLIHALAAGGLAVIGHAPPGHAPAWRPGFRTRPRWHRRAWPGT